MLNVGIDLAAQARDTAACLLETAADGLTQIGVLDAGLEDPRLLELIGSAGEGRTGIDAPFGWPVDFIDAVQRYRERGLWPDAPGQDERQSRMRLRTTDRAVRDALGITPLSVSSDKIAVVAMRCARLLASVWEQTGAPPDRSGTGQLVEVYPAASLRAWGLSQHDHPQDPGTYKGPSAGARRRRARITRAILRAGAGWLAMTPEQVEACVESDHILDAVVSALTARAADLHAVQEPDDLEMAAIEGWIVLPLGRLVTLGGATDTISDDDEPSAERIIPEGGYVALELPDSFTLEIQDRVGGPWSVWAGGLRREWFIRDPDGTYICTGHGGSPVYFRALSGDEQGFEHVDGDGYGHVYRYRLRTEAAATRDE